MSSISAPAKEPSYLKQLAPYWSPPLSASIAIVPVFRDMMVKTALQRGEAVPSATMKERVWEGLKATPATARLVGAQMLAKPFVEKHLVGDAAPNFYSDLQCSAVIGFCSSPFVTIFNGRTMKWTARESLRRLTVKQMFAISLQETAFVFGLSAGEKLAMVLKRSFGEYQAIDYTAAVISGAVGSLAGHPANTAVIRWLDGKTLDNPSQLMLGWKQRTRAVALLSVIYKVANDFFNS